MTDSIANDILATLQQQHQDAVLWKAHYLWKDAQDPDRQAEAIEHMTAMLVAMKNDTKRAGYITLVSKELTSAAKAHQERIEKLRRLIERKEQLAQKLLLKSKHTDDEKDFLDSVEAELKSLQKELTALQLQATSELKEPLIKQSVKDALNKRKAELEALKTKAQFDKEVRTAADAGMPEDFEGSREDIFNALQYGVYVHKGVYYSRGQKGDYEISNFTMQILYHVQTGDETAYRTIAIKNRYGFESTIQMNTDDFVSIGSFKKVIARRGDFVFKGTETDLARLQELLQKNELATKYIDTLGWHRRGKFYAWGNGITPIGEDCPPLVPTDMHGIVEWHGKRYLIPACSAMYADKDEEFVNEKKFVFVQPQNEQFTWERWSRQMVLVYKDRCIPAILHYLGTVFRDIIFKNLHKYPLLNLFGPPGSGKSELAISLMALFGQDTAAMSLEGESTGKSYMRKVAQRENAYVWVDEYKNNQHKHIGNLKNMYDGTGYDRAKMTNDNQTKQTPVRCAIILSGQEMPTGEPALFTRCIMVSFENAGRNPDAFQELKRTEQFGLSYLTAHVLVHREVVAQNFAARQPVIMKELVQEIANSEVIDRMILNISILLTMMDLLKDRIFFPFEYKHAKAVLIENMMHQHYILMGSDNLARWWGIVQQLFYQGLIIEGRDFELEDSKLFIRIMQVHPLYLKEMHAQRDPNFLAKSSLEYYLRLDKSSYVDKKRKRFSDGSNADVYIFHYQSLKIDMIRVSASNEYLSNEQKAARLAVKYREMGLDSEGNPMPTQELPTGQPPTKAADTTLSFDFDHPPEKSETI